METLPLPDGPILTRSGLAEITVDPARTGGRLLSLDGVESSYVDVAHPAHLEFEYLRHVASLVEAIRTTPGALRLFQIGGGPCALARYLQATRRGVRAIIIEVDPAIVDIAERWLGVAQTPSFSLRVDEGRAALAAAPDASADVLVIDAFEGTGVPQHLLSDEFTLIAKRVLSADGTHVVNLIDGPPLDLALATVATLGARYASVLLMADAAVLQHRTASNVVVAASDAALPVDALARACGHDRTPWEVVSGKALRRLVRDRPPIRDDAPVERLPALRDPQWGTGRRGRAT